MDIFYYTAKVFCTPSTKQSLFFVPTPIRLPIPIFNFGGGGRIRTSEPLLAVNNLAGCCIQPLCHASKFIFCHVYPLWAGFHFMRLTLAYFAFWAKRVIYIFPVPFPRRKRYHIRMTKNPLVNAVAALAYIAIVASIMFYGPRIVGPREDTIIVPIAMISLFTFSVAVMAFIFFYQPFQLYFAGEKKTAAHLFLKTVLAFGCITLLAFGAMISGIINT